MLKIIHRVNSIAKLRQVPQQYGVEVDVRGFGSRLVLNHEPLQDGEDFEEYLKEFNHAFIIFDIKEAGIEDEVISLAKKYNITNYFLLDVEFPYIYRAARKGIRNIALRFSEDEDINTALKYKELVDWVWVDTFTRLPLNKEALMRLDGFKLCLVCPERWGRPDDIAKYKAFLTKSNIHIDAVMTTLEYAAAWG